MRIRLWRAYLDRLGIAAQVRRVVTVVGHPYTLILLFVVHTLLQLMIMSRVVRIVGRLIDVDSSMVSAMASMAEVHSAHVQVTSNVVDVTKRIVGISEAHDARILELALERGDTDLAAELQELNATVTAEAKSALQASVVEYRERIEHLEREVDRELRESRESLLEESRELRQRVDGMNNTNLTVLGIVCAMVVAVFVAGITRVSGKAKTSE